ncbi:hypothetical protein AOLI_G00021000 [Acnodon oligacanthus]
MDLRYKNSLSNMGAGSGFLGSSGIPQCVSGCQKACFQRALGHCGGCDTGTLLRQELAHNHTKQQAE